MGADAKEGVVTRALLFVVCLKISVAETGIHNDIKACFISEEGTDADEEGEEKLRVSPKSKEKLSLKNVWGVSEA